MIIDEWDVLIREEVTNLKVQEEYIDFLRILLKGNHVKRWYNGYSLGGYQVYNPKAVVSVMLRGAFRSYWSKTGTYESILPLSNMDFGSNIGDRLCSSGSAN